MFHYIIYVYFLVCVCNNFLIKKDVTHKNIVSTCVYRDQAPHKMHELKTVAFHSSQQSPRNIRVSTQLCSALLGKLRLRL